MPELVLPDGEGEEEGAGFREESNEGWDGEEDVACMPCVSSAPWQTELRMSD